MFYAYTAIEFPDIIYICKALWLFQPLGICIFILITYWFQRDIVVLMVFLKEISWTICTNGDQIVPFY